MELTNIRMRGYDLRIELWIYKNMFKKLGKKTGKKER